MADDEPTISRRSADDASVGDNPLKNNDTDDADDDLHHHSGVFSSDEAAVFEELLAQAVPDPVDRRGCDFCGKPADYQRLLLITDGERAAWLHRRCEVPWLYDQPGPEKTVI